MAHSLTDFKSRLIGGGARPNLFEVEITPGDLPSGIAALDGDVFKYMCKAANLPCLLYTSPSPRDATLSRMPSSA